MSLRKNIAKCIEATNSPDEAARLICGYLYDIGLAEPGNGWFDDDPEMEDDLDRAYEEWNELKRK
jgi:hypothetical protein